MTLANFLEFFQVSTPSQIRWAHRVNSRAALEAALTAPDVHMIEADVLRGADGQIIMAHPPETSSDLPFGVFLAAVAGSPRGLKLDFKDASVVAECLAAVAQAKLTAPLMVNGDILKGPGATLIRCAAEPLLSAYQQFTPTAMLSVGWTTQVVENGAYTPEMVAEMRQLTAGVTGHVTYAVRICYAQASWEALQPLLQAPERSVTFWNNEPVSEAEHAWLQTVPDQSRSFVDLVEA